MTYFSQASAESEGGSRVLRAARGRVERHQDDVQGQPEAQRGSMGHQWGQRRRRIRIIGPEVQVVFC